VGHSGTLTVAGTTTEPGSKITHVTVNSTTATEYADGTFAATNFTPVSGNNTYSASAQDTYGRSSTSAVTVNLPASASYAYDANGNLLTNGTEVLVWNDENELVTNVVAGAWQSVFVYDGKMRRRIEKDYSWNGSSWTQTNEIHFIYDGNVILQHRDGNNLPTLTLTRGNDLSASLQGAGGIGGLLAMTQNALMLQAATQPQATSFYHADGNGNVTMLINANQAIVGKALYDPFGNFLALSGAQAGLNPYWYSSKPIHWPSGKYDFLYRWYYPILQRWPNRDPIGDVGSVSYDQVRRSMRKVLYLMDMREPNNYLFTQNEPLINIDLFGLCQCPPGQHQARTYEQAPYNGDLEKCVADHTRPLRDTGVGILFGLIFIESGPGAVVMGGAGMVFIPMAQCLSTPPGSPCI
jgi:RHS repeat-associated protein